MKYMPDSILRTARYAAMKRGEPIFLLFRAGEWTGKPESELSDWRHILNGRRADAIVYPSGEVTK